MEEKRDEGTGFMDERIYWNHLPATKESAKLQLTPEMEEQCRLVYEKEEGGDRYVFCSFWDPEQKEMYEVGRHIVVPLRSVYGGIFNYQDNTVFANVLGSSSKSQKDSCPSTSWIQLLMAHGISCDSCVMDECFYDSRDLSGKTYFVDKNKKPYKCGGTIDGGHVICDFHAQEMPKNSSVYLLPICHLHNVSCMDDTHRNGSGFFMMPKKSGQGIVLNAYLNP